MKGLLKRNIRFLSRITAIPLVLSIIVVSLCMWIETVYGVEFHLIVMDMGFIETISEYVPPLFWLLIHFGSVLILTLKLSEDERDNEDILLVRVASKNAYHFSYMAAVILVQTLFVTALIVAGSIIGFGQSWQIIFIREAIIFTANITLFSCTVLLFSRRIPYIAVFTIACAYQIAITFTNIRWLPGQSSLLGKQDFIVQGGMTFTEGMTVIAVWAAVLFILNFIFSKLWDRW